MKRTMKIMILAASMVGFAIATSSASAKEVRLENGLSYEIKKEGTGKVATPGKFVHVHYTGWLATRKKFDSSRDRGAPFRFKLGAGQVIKGWDIGVAGMKEGEQRTLRIPSDLGYGAQGAGNAIPPNARLIFDVELIKVD